MKKTLAILALIACVVSVQAQNFIEDHLGDYKTQENATSVVVKSKMFETLLDIEIETDNGKLESYKAILEKIEEFQLLVLEDESKALSIFDNARRVTKDFEEILEVRDGDGHFVFSVRESKDLIREIILVGHGDEDLVVMSLKGWLTMEDINTIFRDLEIEGMKEWKRLGDSSVEEFDIYPNPASPGSTIRISVPEKYIGEELVLHSAKGEVMSSRRIDGSEMNVVLDRVPSGQYYYTITDGQVVLRKAVVISQ